MECSIMFRGQERRIEVTNRQVPTWRFLGEAADERITPAESEGIKKQIAQVFLIERLQQVLNGAPTDNALAASLWLLSNAIMCSSPDRETARKAAKDIAKHLPKSVDDAYTVAVREGNRR